MSPKARAKDKGKATQTQPTKPESSKPSAKLMSSANLSAKPVKSWYEAVIEEEEPTRPPQVQPDTVQHWVDTISKSPELLLALQKIS
jgi:Mrp family chromosome partitioning ATPase